MQIEELSTLLNVSILIRNDEVDWTAYFENAVFKDLPSESVGSIEIFGHGGTPNEALKDLTQLIKGKYLIIGKKEAAFKIPHSVITI